MDTAASDSSRAELTHSGTPPSLMTRANDPFGETELADDRTNEPGPAQHLVPAPPKRLAETSLARGPVALAGCLLWRRTGATRSAAIEIALVLREGRWCLPRVVLQAGEDRRDAARRAALELCGTHTIDDAFIGERHEVRAGHSLSTWWWRVIPLSRDPAFEGAAWTTWLAFGEALARLATDEDRRVLSAARPAHPPSAWRKRTTRGLTAIDAEIAVARATYRNTPAADALALAEQHLARLDVVGARRALAAAHRAHALSRGPREREALLERLALDLKSWPPGPWCVALETALGGEHGLTTDEQLDEVGADANGGLARALEAHAAGRRVLSRAYFARRLQAAGLGGIAAFGFALAMGASGWALCGAAIGAAALLGILAPGGPRNRSRIENDSV
jgi:hypothetical protein